MERVPLTAGRWDVLVTSTSAVHEATDLLDSQPPIEEPIRLASDLVVGWLDHDIADAILDACEPRGFAHKPHRQFGGSYTFVRAHLPEPDGNPYTRDPDETIMTTVALSRLIQPTEVGTKYAAKVVIAADGKVVEIIPGPVSGHSEKAYLVPHQRRRWLTHADGMTLARLLDTYLQTKAGLPDRVRRALWMHEYGVYIHWLNARWTVMATALEALVHTDRHDSTAQFERAASLATITGVSGFGAKEAREAYALRSELSHGATLSLKHPQGDDHVFRLGEAMEETLRRSIRQAIENPAFRDVFKADQTIRDRWPVAKRQSR
jgi:hypothetical protein